jgi:hypothetical protein
MPRHESGAFDTDTKLGLQDAHRRQADGHERRLGVLGQGQILDRTFAHEAGQLLAQRIVDLLENLSRRGEGVRQFSAHPDRLTTLAGKEESKTHGGSVP